MNMKLYLFVLLLLIALMIYVVKKYHIIGNIAKNSMVKSYISRPFNDVWTDDERKNMAQILNIINENLYKNNINYMMSFDALLGLIKINTFLPWSNFISICVEDKDLDQLQHILKLKVVKMPFKIKSYSISFDTFPYVIASGYHIDKNNQVIIQNPITSKKYMIGRTEDVFPVKKYSNFNVPKNYSRVLDKIYPKWKDECSSSIYDCKTMKMNNSIVRTSWGNLRTVGNDIFDYVWVINLSYRMDRWETTKNRLGKLGINPKRWDAIDAKSKPFIEVYNMMEGQKRKDGEVACYLSHYTLWKYIYEQGYPYALIFEDDILIPDNVSKDTIKLVIDNSVGFNILFLGYCFGAMPFNKPISKVGHGMCLHAYIVSRDGLGKLLKWMRPKYMAAIDHITNNFCMEELCFLSYSVPSSFDDYGDGIIVQDRKNLGSNIAERAD